ncbi:MAG TPA: hypothetical protein VMT17_19445 [Anaeromyxobacteraceae bacterium]|nr:hypothetical protein [Anaeromyxobacteraceae bacterium]
MAEEREQAVAHRRRSPLTWLVVAGLGILVLWLLADRNSREWWLVPEDGRVVVKKGVLLPTGKATFKSDDPELSRTYAPVTPPSGATLPQERSFEDRAALDQALFELLARWAKEDIRSEQLERMQRARDYLARAARLAGVSAAQREELRVMQGETAFHEATWHLEQGAESLRHALDQLRLASEARGPVAAEALALLKALEPVIAGANQSMLEASRFSSERYRSGVAPGAPPPAEAPAPDGGPPRDR